MSFKTVKIFKHRKRTQVLGYRSPDWFKSKLRGLTSASVCGKVKARSKKAKKRGGEEYDHG